MSALGQKQTCRSDLAMPALPPKADIGRLQLDVRFVPILLQNSAITMCRGLPPFFSARDPGPFGALPR